MSSGRILGYRNKSPFSLGLNSIDKQLSEYTAEELAKNFREAARDMDLYDYTHHALALKAKMDNEGVPQEIQQSVLPEFSAELLSTMIPEDYELASAIQTGSITGPYEFEDADPSEMLDWALQVSGKSAQYRAAARASQKAMLDTGLIQDAVVMAKGAYVEALIALGEFSDVYVEKLSVDEVIEKYRNNSRALAQHIADQAYRTHSIAYGRLVGSLKKAGASQSFLEQIAKGSGVTAFHTDGFNPAMGAAIQAGIEGRSVLSDPTLSYLDKLAGERARLEHETFGDPFAAAKAGMEVVAEAKDKKFGEHPDKSWSDTQIADYALNSFREGLVSSPPQIENGRVTRGSFQVGDPNYAGPSHEFSPEDFMTPDQLAQQLARNTAIRAFRDRAAVATSAQRSLLDGLTAFHKGDEIEAAKDMWGGMVSVDIQQPGYKMDVYKASDKSLKHFADRHGMTYQDVYALNNDKITRNGNVEVGQALLVRDTPNKPTAPTSWSRPSISWSRSMLDKAPDADYPSKEYTEVDNPITAEEVAAHLSSKRAETPSAPKQTKTSTFGPKLDFKPGEDPVKAGARFIEEAKRFGAMTARGLAYTQGKTNTLTTALTKPAKAANAFAGAAQTTGQQIQENSQRISAEINKANAQQSVGQKSGMNATGQIFDAVTSGPTSLAPINEVREVAALKVTPLREVVFTRGDEQFVYGYPEEENGKRANQMVLKFSEDQKAELAVNGYIHDEDGNVVSKTGRRVSADEEKNWGNSEDHMAIDGARADKRGQERSKNASTKGGGQFDERGNLTSVNGQKANPNQTNQARNKDGTYSLDANGNGAGDAGGTVICTELHRRGLLTDCVYSADGRFGARLAISDPDVILGYHAWAKPLVKLMQRSELVTSIVYYGFAKAWAEEMAGREGLNSIGTLRGKMLMALGLPMCRWIGRFARWRREIGAFRVDLG